jgi:hypothetical protein
MWWLGLWLMIVLFLYDWQLIVFMVDIGIIFFGFGGVFILYFGFCSIN